MGDVIGRECTFFFKDGGRLVGTLAGVDQTSRTILVSNGRMFGTEGRATAKGLPEQTHDSSKVHPLLRYEAEAFELVTKVEPDAPGAEAAAPPPGPPAQAPPAAQPAGSKPEWRGDQQHPDPAQHGHYMPTSAWAAGQPQAGAQAQPTAAAAPPMAAPLPAHARTPAGGIWGPPSATPEAPSAPAEVAATMAPPAAQAPAAAATAVPAPVATAAPMAAPAAPTALPNARAPATWASAVGPGQQQQGGRGGAGRHRMGGRSTGVPVANRNGGAAASLDAGDFDFQASNMKFQEEKQAAEGTTTAAPGAVPGKKPIFVDDFFDNIGCGVAPTDGGVPMPRRPNLAEQREINMQTFGSSQPVHYRPRGRGAPHGAQGRGRGGEGGDGMGAAADGGGYGRGGGGRRGGPRRGMPGRDNMGRGGMGRGGGGRGPMGAPGRGGGGRGDGMGGRGPGRGMAGRAGPGGRGAPGGPGMMGRGRAGRAGRGREQEAAAG